jgi:hypothetical protein
MNVMKTACLSLLCLLAPLAAVKAQSPTADTSTTTTLSRLPDNGLTPRVDTIKFTLNPAHGAIRGKRGETVGWGFKVEWASNAGDRLSFTKSSLLGDFSHITSGAYTDVISQFGGNDVGVVNPGTTWEQTFQSQPTLAGVGFLTIDPNAVIGAQYIGQLQLHYTVLDSNTSAQNKLGVFTATLDVTVTVDPPSPPSPLDQVITFAPIADIAVNAAPVPVSATSDSGLPVKLASLNPSICALVDGMLTPVAAGTCTVEAWQDGNDWTHPAASIRRTFQVLKVPATVAITGSLDRSYNGSDQTISTTTSPPGLPVDMLYNGDTIPPRDPGIYLVQALIDDPAYTGAAEVMLTITDHTPAPVSQYASWLQTNFTPQEILDGTFTDPNAYLAGDGFSNLFKYAMGLDPWAPLSATDRSALPRLSGSGPPTFVFDIPTTAAADVIITIQANSDLVSTNWQEIARRVGSGPWTGPADVFTGTPNPEGTRQSILVTEPPTPIYNSRFYRLEILPNP